MIALDRFLEFARRRGWDGLGGVDGAIAFLADSATAAYAVGASGDASLPWAIVRRADGHTVGRFLEFEDAERNARRLRENDTIGYVAVCRRCEGEECMRCLGRGLELRRRREDAQMSEYVGPAPEGAHYGDRVVLRTYEVVR